MSTLSESHIAVVLRNTPDMQLVSEEKIQNGVREGFPASVLSTLTKAPSQS